MFTGLVSDVGEVLGVEERGELRRLCIASRYDTASIEIGASIAHAGVCLTVVEIAREGNRTVHQVDVAAETLAVTNAREWIVGTRLNLERSLRLGEELGGHMVSGHVDGLAEIVERRDFDGMAHFNFRAPAELSRFIAQKGSVALDGTSLTVNAVNDDEFETLLIPHTLAATSWGARKAGDKVNIEVDPMARYAARLLEARGRGES
jgi:riboflavin synthase